LLRPTTSEDEGFLWSMLYYASHSNDESGVGPDDIRADPHLVGYISGWQAIGRVGFVAEMKGEAAGAVWLRALTDEEASNPVYIDAETPELAIAVRPGREGQGIGSALLAQLLGSVSGRFPGIVLSARAESDAVRLYERFGFSVVDFVTNRVGTSSVKMLLRFD
jgi:ribosomal protein S18 acetylase RimI-like enzyme